VERPSAYRGSESYNFVCYAHSDAAQIYPLIYALSEQGARIWYDEGITPGVSWTEDLANAISGCDRVLFFVSSASINSGYCLDEINYALEHGIDVVCIYLEDIDLPPGLKLSLSRRQAIVRSKHTDASFLEQIQDLAAGRLGMAPSMPAPGEKHKWLMPLITAVVLIAVISTAYLLNDRKETDKKSLLILPFESIYLDEDLAYLPNTLNTDLISRMTRTENLKVIASVSARNLLTSGLTIQEMAQTADVDTVLIGTIEQMADQLRITVNLISADDDSVIWTQQFDDELTSLMAMQSEITTRLARSLSIRLDDAKMAQLSASGTDSIEAFDMMLQLSELIRSNDNPAQFERGSELARKLVEVDPEFADGWAIRASTDFIHNAIINGRASDARSYAERALSLDPDNPRALRAMGLILIGQDPAQASKYLKRAIELAPGRAFYYMDLALAQRNMMQADEAMKNLAIASDLDPLNPIIRSNLVSGLLRLGRLEEAERHAVRGTELQPNSYIARNSLAEVLFKRGDHFSGLKEMLAVARQSDFPLINAGFILKLIELNQLQAAANWARYFSAESPQLDIYRWMQGRITKSVGEPEALASLIEAWRAAGFLDESLALKLDASLLYLRANVEADGATRETLHRQALTLLLRAESLQPIQANPLSDLSNFIILQQEYGDAEFANDLLNRFKPQPQGVLATQHMLPSVISRDFPAVIQMADNLASLGLLHLPFLRELGVLGENKSLFGNLSDEPGFQAAVEKQKRINENLRRRVRAELPELLNGPPS
jgi:TolB-like protein/Flp pilus assembly protein TadD